MYRRDEFRTYFVDVVGATSNTANTYVSNLNRIDKALGGLDDAISAKGAKALMDWTFQTKDAPFDTYPSNARSALKRYIHFTMGGGEFESVGLAEDIDPEPIASSSIFKLEKEMQNAVRGQLDKIEAGLTAEDGGSEYSTSTGSIDIMARDKNGNLVVIELKAGACPSGALEQALGYAQSLSDEKDENVRAILIAASFSDRIRAAAKRIHDLNLYEYKFDMAFSELA